MDQNSPPTPTLSATDIQRATGDFPRRHLWVRIFTVINGLSILVNAFYLNLLSALLATVLFIASISAWRATNLFTAAHQSGNKAALFDAMEQLEKYFKMSTITLVAGALMMVLIIAGLLFMILLFGPAITEGMR